MLERNLDADMDNMFRREGEALANATKQKVED